MNVTRLNYDGAEKLAEIRLLTLKHTRIWE